MKTKTLFVLLVARFLLAGYGRGPGHDRRLPVRPTLPRPSMANNDRRLTQNLAASSRTVHYSRKRGGHRASCLGSSLPTSCSIIMDDAGFSVPSTFGGVIPTPAMDRVAKTGLRYNTTSTPPRSAHRRALRSLRGVTITRPGSV